MTPFTPEQWIILILVFVLGMIIGMYVLASGKWKRRYREELALRQQCEADNKRLRDEALEKDSLHRAALRNPPPNPERGPI